MKILKSSLVVAVLCGVCAHADASVWTVDMNGGGNFTSIVTAIASPAVVDGDTLRVVPAGSYAPFTLTKSLEIVGVPGGARPKVFGKSFVTAAGGAALGGFDVNGLEFVGVAGPI